VAVVSENVALGADLFVLRLAGCEGLEGAKAGQFVMVRGDWGRDPLLPRAMSIMRARDGRADLLIKAVGRGTRLLQQARSGERLSILGPLGRSFPAPEARRHVLVAGGLLEDLRRTGVDVIVATEDGMAGRRGRVTEVLPLDERPRLLACGPAPMLQALHSLALERSLECYLSVEEEMGCGVRVCLGCALPGRDRPYLYACSDGPVFRAEEIRW
jgi:dihydroorotate dehydrogenase electron transfer subunit